MDFHLGPKQAIFKSHNFQIVCNECSITKRNNISLQAPIKAMEVRHTNRILHTRKRHQVSVCQIGGG